MIDANAPHSATPKNKPYFELLKVFKTEQMVLTFGNQKIRFDVRELDDLKQEIEGWELRYYGD